MRLLLILGVAGAIVLAARTNRMKNPVELGQVSWYRDYDEAQAVAKKTKRDLFVLFQEVPG